MIVTNIQQKKRHILSLLQIVAILMLLLPVIVFFIVSLSRSTVQATSTAGFNAGRIIDDSVFTNSSTMSVTDIQNFLNSKVPSCDTNGTQPSEFGGGTRAQWGAAHGNPAPFICLKDYTENGQTAAQMIYNVAQQFRINPQVLIVLLQKEQGLVTDTWPLNTQYKTATGYGCPDTAACDSQYFGLGNQLTWSGRMFRSIMDNNPNWYTPYILGQNYIQYNPDSSCGGSTVNIENRATQALYNYTPYQPNQAALDAGYGMASCGAYGNRNFYLYFSDWFGPTSGPAYSWNLESFTAYSDPAHTIPINDGSVVGVQPGQPIYVHVTARNKGGVTWKKDTLKIGTPNYFPILRDSSWVANDRAAYMNEDSVAYDQLATFDYKITTPQHLASYNQNFNLVIDNVTWFNNAGPTLQVNVTAPNPIPADSSANMISRGAQLLPGQTVFSADKNSALRFADGQISLYVNLKRVWNTPADTRAYKFIHQDDGNLVLYRSDGSAIWASNTNGRATSTLKLQADGNLVLYDTNNTALWSTNSSVVNQGMRVNNFLKSDQVILNGQQLTTPDRKYKLILQDDGNLVLYSPTRALWATNTEGSKAKQAILQSDGNLVLYTDSLRPVWATNTEGRRNAYFTIQDDHNLVIYTASDSPVWASHTEGR